MTSGTTQHLPQVKLLKKKVAKTIEQQKITFHKKSEQQDSHFVKSRSHMAVIQNLRKRVQSANKRTAFQIVLADIHFHFSGCISIHNQQFDQVLYNLSPIINDSSRSGL